MFWLKKRASPEKLKYLKPCTILSVMLFLVFWPRAKCVPSNYIFEGFWLLHSWRFEPLFQILRSIDLKRCYPIWWLRTQEVLWHRTRKVHVEIFDWFSQSPYDTLTKNALVHMIIQVAIFDKIDKGPRFFLKGFPLNDIV